MYIEKMVKVFELPNRYLFGFVDAKLLKRVLAVRTQKDDREWSLPSSHLLDNWWMEMVFRYAAASVFLHGSVILDAGCGCGWGAFILAHKAEEIVCIDKDPDAIEFAIKNFGRKNMSFLLGDVTSLPFPARKFDGIVCFEVLEHLYPVQAKALFREFYRVLNNGGFILLSSFFPHKQTPPRGLFHVHFYTPIELKSMLDGFEFNIVKNRYLIGRKL